MTVILGKCALRFRHEATGSSFLQVHKNVSLEARKFVLNSSLLGLANMIFPSNFC